MTTTDRKLIAYIAAMILLSVTSSIILAQIPKSELFSPPFLNRPDITEAVPCRPVISGVLLRLSVDVTLWSVGILLLSTLVRWARKLLRE